MNWPNISGKHARCSAVYSGPLTSAKAAMILGPDLDDIDQVQTWHKRWIILKGNNRKHPSHGLKIYFGASSMLPSHRWSLPSKILPKPSPETRKVNYSYHFDWRRWDFQFANLKIWQTIFFGLQHLLKCLYVSFIFGITFLSCAITIMADQPTPLSVPLSDRDKGLVRPY